MEQESEGGEEETSHLWNEDLHNNHNNHNHDDESTPRAHTRSCCKRIKRLRIQLLRCWITVQCWDQWWCGELWQARLSSSLDSCSLCVCVVLVGCRHTVPTCSVSDLQSFKKEILCFLIWNYGLHFFQHRVIVSQTQQYERKEILKVRMGWQATKSMCYLCWDNRQQKERRAENKFCLLFLFFIWKKILPPSYLTKKTVSPEDETSEMVSKRGNNLSPSLRVTVSGLTSDWFFVLPDGLLLAFSHRTEQMDLVQCFHLWDK